MPHAEILNAEAEREHACISDVPVTCARPPGLGLEEKGLFNPGLPRANYAPSVEKPTGSADAAPPPNCSVLQQHCMFWDRDGDGVVWPWDTYVGFRRLGFNLILSLLAVPALHTLAIFTSPAFPFFNPLLPLHLKNIHRTKHGSDSGVYDHEGRYEPAKFERIMSFDRDEKGGLNFWDLMRMCNAQMLVVDPFGWLAARAEWGALWLVAADEHGVVSKEKIRAQYDGTLWELIAREVEEKRARKAGLSKKVFQDTMSAAKEKVQMIRDQLSNRDAIVNKMK